MKNITWLPAHEAELWKKYNEDLKKEAKETDWAFKALLQMKAEKGDFDNLEPIIRHRILMIAYN